MSDKLNKNINESMLEGLLSDEDKPKPPKPVSTPYNYGNSSYRGGQNSFDWSRGDNLDGFSGGRVPRKYYDDEEDEDYYRPAHTYRGGTTSQPTKLPPTGKYVSGAAIGALQAALDKGLHSGQKHYFMPPDASDALCNAVVRCIGEVFDAVGLVWGANGSRAAKALVLDMLATNMMYNTPTRGYKELDFGDAEPVTTGHDPVTGEVDDNDEERRAIQEVDGGPVEEK